MLHGKQYIGNHLSSLGKTQFESRDPGTGGVVGTFYETSTEEVDLALEKAVQAFEVYGRMPDHQRAEFLGAIAAELEKVTEELVRVYTRESGLPEGRARGELGRTTGQLRAFASLLREPDWRGSHHQPAQPGRQPNPAPELYRSRIPIGPVVVFGASNFPLAFSTAGGDTASALAAGCPVIVKGHPLHPGTGEVVAAAVIRAAEQTGMPDGVFSNLNGLDHTLGKKLVMHPDVRGVGFTGSLKAGRALYDMAATREIPIPVFAEMGSVNPVILSPLVQERKGVELATQLVTSFTLGGGQFCTCPGLILASGFKESFLKQLRDLLEQAPAQCMLSTGLKENYQSSRSRILEQEGVELIHGSDDPGGCDILPSLAIVSGFEFLKNAHLQEEVFGPFTLLVDCTGEEELLKVVDHLRGQLTISLFAEDEELPSFREWLYLFSRKAGRVILNAMPTGVEVSPAMTHGGPYPATTDARFTSVGTTAIDRWLRPVTFQGFPQEHLKAFTNEPS